MRKLTQKDGETLANTLLHELTPSVATVPGVKANQVAKLLGVPPSRDELAFYQTNKEDAPKVTLEDPDVLLHLFCISHCDYTLRSGTDIEHGTPFADIRERQQKLLELLNASDIHAEFLDGFLNYSIVNSYGDKISDYLQRDTTAGKIKGTQYFYKLCYNDIENLALMCHACNITKSDTDIIAWLGKQEPFFGKAFLDDVKKTGGAHQGVILQKICLSVPSRSDESVVQLSDTLGYKHYTADSIKTEGLGQYVRKWYHEKNKKFYEANKRTFLEISGVLRAELVNNLKARDNDELAYVKLMRKFDQQTTDMKGLIAAMKDSFVGASGRSSPKSTSSSDDSQEKNMREEQSKRDAVTRHFKMHSLKKIKKFLQGVLDISEDAFNSLWAEYSNKCMTNQSYQTVEAMCDDLFMRLSEKFTEQKKLKPDATKIAITLPELKEMLEDVFRHHATTNMTIAEAENLKRQLAEQGTEIAKERALRLEAENKLKRKQEDDLSPPKPPVPSMFKSNN